ncbi:MAG: site-specific DNA-methyltransferase [Gemmatimonadota bacterium]
MAARKPKGNKHRAKPKPPAKGGAAKGATRSALKAAATKGGKAAAKTAPKSVANAIAEALPCVAPAEVTVTAAKGRPMLTWVGKRALERVTAFPAQHVERYDPAGELANASRTGAWKDWPDGYPAGGLLFHGDNKEVLAHLLANGFRGKVKLIYIDPPFDSGADYVRKVSLRGAKGTAKLDGVSYSLGEQVQYTDIWANDNYLQFMYERLQLLKELLSDGGAIYLHCDARKSHHLRSLLDEVFGSDAFVSEIVWQSSDAQSSANRYGPIHNTIFYYAKPGRIWHDVRTPLSKSTADNWYNNEERVESDLINRLGKQVAAGSVRRFNMSDLTARKKGGDTEGEWRGVRPPVGRYWAYSRENLDQFDKEGRIAFSSSGRPYLKRYLDEVEGTPPQDLWTDISMLRGISGDEDTGYPTEKPEGLLDRIVRVSTNPTDLILDCFIGSGTTAAVAQKLGRRWIGCDINKGAIQTTAKRLQSVIGEQMDAAASARKKNVQGSLLDAAAGKDAPPAPAQSAFTVWRVNDYDLQIQHNEAVNLACEHLGVTRNRADGFFDGTRGQNLVKIIPFGHPLSPLDLDEIRRELDARPDETRSVTVVSLGIEAQARVWVDGWNRSRRGSGGVNAIDVIELRTDERYGRVIRHVPASARASITRKGPNIHVVIKDFVSPSIFERLAAQAGVLAPDVDDWRAMVDCVMIDPAWDGNVFNVALSDIPERKTDLVAGEYQLPAAAGTTTVAVKIIDMLGEEVLVTKEV